jgi:SMC interacting uncharacterized protein involved in chromosome segregation
MDQLDKIKIVAEKLKSLRSKRDEEKKKFDDQVIALANVRKEINQQKDTMKQMYQKAGIQFPKMG